MPTGAGHKAKLITMASFLHHLLYGPCNLCQPLNWSGFFTQRSDPSHHSCKIHDLTDPILSGLL